MNKKQLKNKEKKILTGRLKRYKAWLKKYDKIAWKWMVKLAKKWIKRDEKRLKELRKVRK